ARAHRLQRCRFADDAVTRLERLRGCESLCAETTDLFVGGADERERALELFEIELCERAERRSDERLRVACAAPVESAFALCERERVCPSRIKRDGVGVPDEREFNQLIITCCARCNRHKVVLLHALLVRVRQTPRVKSHRLGVGCDPFDNFKVRARRDRINADEFGQGVHDVCVLIHCHNVRCKRAKRSTISVCAWCRPSCTTSRPPTTTSRTAVRASAKTMVGKRSISFAPVIEGSFKSTVKKSAA